MIFQAETARGGMTYSARCDKCGFLSRMGCKHIDYYISMLTGAGWAIEGSDGVYRCTCPKCNSSNRQLGREEL